MPSHKAPSRRAESKKNLGTKSRYEAYEIMRLANYRETFNDNSSHIPHHIICLFL